MPKKDKRKTLGLVPRSLLRGAIAGAIPACALTGCSSQSLSRDASDGPGFTGVADAFFAVDAPAFTPDAGTDAAPDRGFTGVADAYFKSDTSPDTSDGPSDSGPDRAQFGVADVGFRRDGAVERPDASSEDRFFFAVDALAFKG